MLLMVLACFSLQILFFFFFNDTATTEIYTLSLHDALPISICPMCFLPTSICSTRTVTICWSSCARDRKSTRLNSSHSQISYAVFCLKKKKKTNVMIFFLLYQQRFCSNRDMYSRYMVILRIS